MNFQRFWELGPEHMKFIASDFIALEEINNRSIIFDSQVPIIVCLNLNTEWRIPTKQFLLLLLQTKSTNKK